MVWATSRQQKPAFAVLCHTTNVNNNAWWNAPLSCNRRLTQPNAAEHIKINPPNRRHHLRDPRRWEVPQLAGSSAATDRLLADARRRRVHNAVAARRPSLQRAAVLPLYVKAPTKITSDTPDFEYRVSHQKHPPPSSARNSPGGCAM